MARAMRSIAQARQNLEQSVAVIPQRYSEGVDGADWQTAAASEQAETNFATSMQRVTATKARQLGVRKVSNEDWKQRAKTKGAQNIGTGVQAGLDKYERNFGQVYSKVQTEIAKLPARTTDPVQNVNTRVIPVVKAWHANKMRGRA